MNWRGMEQNNVSIFIFFRVSLVLLAPAHPAVGRFTKNKKKTKVKKISQQQHNILLKLKFQGHDFVTHAVNGREINCLSILYVDFAGKTENRAPDKDTTDKNEVKLENDKVNESDAQEITTMTCLTIVINIFHVVLSAYNYGNNLITRTFSFFTFSAATHYTTIFVISSSLGHVNVAFWQCQDISIYNFG